MEELHRSWGRRVEGRRKELGFSQDALADLCGIGQATISRIERGKQCPSDDLKWLIAGALKSTMEQLFPYPAVVPPFPEAKAS